MNAAVYLTTICSWLLQLLSSIAAQQARIIVPPKSVNAGLNKTIIFTCTAIANNIRWRVNKTFIGPDLRSRGFDDSSPQITLNITQNLRTSTMVVSASSENNNTNITCFSFISIISVDESEAALLLVFEPGSQQVSNLTVMLINSTTVLISWSPRFTLEGVPILGYNVTITNTTSGENKTMLVEDTTLLYSIDHPDPVNNFTATVVPINEVGAGQPANSAEPFLFLSEPTVLRVTSSPIVNVTSRLTMPIEKSHPLTVLQPRSSIAHPVFVTMTSTVVPLIITTDSSDTVVSALIAVVVVAMIIILGLTATLVWRCHATKKQKINRTANTPQVLDEVPVRDNPAYQLVNLRKSWNTSISMHVTTSPTHQASQLYENIMEVDKKYGEDDNEYDYENLKV